LGLWCLTPLSTIFQLYINVVSELWICQWMKPKYLETITELPEVSDELVTLFCIEYTSSRMRIKLRTVEMTNIGYIGRCKTNYHMILCPYIVVDTRSQDVKQTFGWGYGGFFRCLTPLSTIFQLYRGGYRLSCDVTIGWKSRLSIHLNVLF
jgi:hypothetical protein